MKNKDEFLFGLWHVCPVSSSGQASFPAWCKLSSKFSFMMHILLLYQRGNHIFRPSFLLLSRGRWARYCDQRVCMSVCQSVCLSACIFQNRSPNFAQYIFCTCYLAVARSSSHSNAIRYVLSVLCMDDVYMFSHNEGNGPLSNTTRMFRRVCQVAAPRRSLPSQTVYCCKMLWFGSVTAAAVNVMLFASSADIANATCYVTHNSAKKQ